jgi:hypothetical protein
VAEAVNRYWAGRSDFGTLTTSFAGAGTFGTTFPNTSNGYVNAGPVGPVFGWFGFSHNGTDSDIQFTASLVVKAQQTGAFFSTIGQQGPFSTVIASGSTANIITYNMMTGANMTGHLPFFEMRYSMSKTAAGAASITYGAGMGFAAF